MEYGWERWFAWHPCWPDDCFLPRWLCWVERYPVMQTAEAVNWTDEWGSAYFYKHRSARKC